MATRAPLHAAALLQAGGRRAAPIWFTAGGKALYFWLLGQVQRLVGWPVDGMVSGMFGLDKPPQ